MSLIKELAISLPIVIIIAIIGTHLVVVPTGSMSPAINEGDMVLVEKTDVLGLFEELHPESVKTGDIIIYGDHESNEFVIHRVIGINESEGSMQLTMKGDNNSEADEGAVNSSQITGRVLTWGDSPIKIPQVGWAVLWFNGMVGSH
jgi:signal peptidase